MNKSSLSFLLLSALTVYALSSVTWARPFIKYPPQRLTPELAAILDEGQYTPAISLEKIKTLLAKTSDRRLRSSLLHQAAQFAQMANKRSEGRAFLLKMVDEYPNSNIDFDARYRLIDLDFDFDDINGTIGAVGILVQRFGGPPLEQLAARQQVALSRIRNLQPDLRNSLGTGYGCLATLYGRKRDVRRAVAFAQLNREMNFGGEGPRSVLKDLNQKSWRGQTTQNPVVKVLKPTSHRTGSRPRIVVEISDGDYREPQLNWEKFEFKLDGQDLKMKAMNKSQFDTQLRENRIFERLRMIYRPETPLAPGQHTLLIYAPVHGYKGTGLGATRLEYRFQVPPPNQRNSNDRDDEGAESDDRDFH